MKTMARMMLTTLLCTQALGGAATPEVVHFCDMFPSFPSCHSSAAE
jgi:hypothetical protein